MSEPGRETLSEKLRIAFALIDVAERMLRQRLRRESPAISERSWKSVWELGTRVAPAPNLVMG